MSFKSYLYKLYTETNIKRVTHSTYKVKNGLVFSIYFFATISSKNR